MQGEILKMIIVIWLVFTPLNPFWIPLESLVYFFCLCLCKSQKAAKEFSFPLAFSRLSLCLLDWAAVNFKPEEQYSKIHP